MKEFSCGDVVPGCTARFSAKSEDQIINDVAVHAERDHGMAEIPEDVVAAALKNIRG